MSARPADRRKRRGPVRYVDLPPEVGAGFEGRTPPVPRGAGQFRLALNAEVRRAAGRVDEGDRAEITLAPTTAHPVPELPPDLVAALGAHPGRRLAFEAWAPGRRRALLGYLAQARSPGTRAKRVRRVLELLGFD